MANAKILIVDDEPGMLEVCHDTLVRLKNVQVVLDRQSDHAAHRLKEEPFDLLITDLRMPGINGIELLKIARQHHPDLPVLILTAYPTVETAIQSMKLGATDYLTKPFLPDDLQATVARMLKTKKLSDENHVLTKQMERICCFDQIIGQCDAMQKVFHAIECLAQSDADVLILGETGTGKELVASSIHRRSARRTGKFVPVDCGAIPEDLLESEFFGHERGAFTGAHTRSMGLLEFADKGTFFLDEIGELPLRLQAKLLRVLQERQIRRVGGKNEIDIDVRVICATSRDMEKEIREGRFRSDLFYRINVGRVVLPPLRKRKADIPLLIEHFIASYTRNTQTPKKVELTPDAMEILCCYTWPGNIRELQNVIKRTLTMHPQAILGTEQLPSLLVEQTETPTHRETETETENENETQGFFDFRKHQMSLVEKNYLTRLLQTCHGDVTAAASKAKLPRGTLYRFLKKLQICPEDFRV